MTATPINLAKYAWALAASLISLIVGGWLVLAPFALGYQPYGASWTNQTTNSFWVGIAVVVVSLASIFLFVASLRGEIRPFEATRPETQPAAPAPERAPAEAPSAAPLPDGEFERSMTALVSALAADLAARQSERKEESAARYDRTSPQNDRRAA